MDERTPPSRPDSCGFSDQVLSSVSGILTKESQALPPLDRARPVEAISILSRAFGKEWVEWEPETLWAEVKSDLGVAPSDALKNKIQAAKSILVSEVFWKDHLAFEKIVMAFNNHVPLFDQYQHPSVAMLANGVEEAEKIRKAEFSDDVLRYIAVVGYEDGFIVLPEPLGVAQESLNEMSSVGRQFRDDIARRWEEAKAGKAPEGMYAETPTGIQLARMAAVREYVETF